MIAKVPFEGVVQGWQAKAKMSCRQMTLQWQLCSTPVHCCGATLHITVHFALQWCSHIPVQLAGAQWPNF